MKKPFFTIFCLLLISACFAQQSKDTAIRKNSSKSHKFSMGGAIGYGVPVEAYGTSIAGTQYGNDIGYADPGIHFNMNLNYQPYTHWGVLIECEGNFNDFNPDLFGGNTFSDGYYYFGEYLAGLFYSQHLTERLVSESRITAGVIDIFGTLDSYPKYAGSKNGWGAELGEKLKMNISKIVSLTLEVSYSHAEVLEPTNQVMLPIGNGPIGILTGGIGIDLKF
jgi:hypothetical protein